MKKSLIMPAFLALILLLTGCAQQEEKTTKGNTVEITNLGFSPRTITINAGETLTFINKDTEKHWPASAVHPTHESYPEKGGCIGSTFDACKNLEQGETFSFTFQHKGTWYYHDHLNPKLNGKIIVE